MEKILILTASEDRHFYLCNKLIQHYYSVCGVITGGKKTGSNLTKKIRKKIRHPFKLIRNSILNIIFIKYRKILMNEKEIAENYYFKGCKDYFYKNYSNYVVANVEKKDKCINDKRFIEIIKKLKPNIIIVMGTCLISEEIIKLSPNVINLHTGLSPYFRGGYTNFWPFILREFNCFGVTIHKLSNGIDAGDIYYSKKISYKSGDNFGKINCLSIIEGVDLLMKTLDRLRSGDLKSCKQWEKGFVFNNFELNNYIIYKYFSINNNSISIKLSDHFFNSRKIKTVNNGRIIVN